MRKSKDLILRYQTRQGKKRHCTEAKGPAAPKKRNRTRVINKTTLAAATLLLICLNGCATFYNRRTPAHWLGIFPGENSAYLAINRITDVVPLLWAQGPEALPPELAAILADTDKIYAAVERQPGQPRVFHAVLVGHYSYFLIHLGLDLHKDWQRQGEPVEYFVHRRSGLKIANPNGSLILISTGEIESLKQDLYQPMPVVLKPDVAELLNKTELLLFFPSFADGILPPSLPFNLTSLPLQAAWFTLDNQEGIYSLGGGFSLPERAQAEKFLKSFKLFLTWWMKEAGLTTALVAAKTKKIELEITGGELNFGQVEYSSLEFSAALQVLLSKQPN